MSLTKKLVLALLLVSLIPIAVIVAVSQGTFVKQAQHEIGTRLEDSVLQAAKSMDEFLLGCLRDTKSIASDPDLSSPDHQIIHEHLSRFVDSFPYFDQVMLVDNKGGIVASSNRLSTGQSLFMNFSDTRNEFVLALQSAPGSVYISDPLHQADSKGHLSNGLIGLRFLVPVQDGEGRHTGVLIANVVPQPLLVFLQDLKRQAPGDEFPCLLDKGGQVLMSADPKASLFATHPDVRSGALRAPLDSRDNGYLVYQGSHGSKLMAGHTSLGTYGTNQAGGWRLITLASYSAIMKRANDTSNRMWALLLVTLVGTAVFGIWLGHRLAKPVLRLTAGAKAITAGHYDSRVAVTADDEIGALTHAFNQMAGGLEETRSAMQNEVAERSRAQEIAGAGKGRIGAGRGATDCPVGERRKRTQTGRGSRAKERGPTKCLFQCLSDGHGNGGLHSCDI